MGGSKPYQRFTSIGRMLDDDVYPYDVGNGFVPLRRKDQYLPCKEISIRPMIQQLSFIKDKKRWGAPFRFGHLEISEKDIDIIAKEMEVNP